MAMVSILVATALFIKDSGIKINQRERVGLIMSMGIGFKELSMRIHRREFQAGQSGELLDS